MERYSIGEVIEQAVQTERLGYDFYTTIGARFADHEGLKKLFDTLAAKEKVHEKRFSELKEITGDDEPEGWDEVSQYLRAIVESEFFLGRHKSLPSLTEVKTVEDAVNFAMGFEKETLLYFHTIREVLKEPHHVAEQFQGKLQEIGPWIIQLR
jgi:rubrerythrin